MNERNKRIIQIALVVAFGVFLGASFFWDFAPGEAMGKTFAGASWIMIKLLPPVFVLLALFDVWVKRETIERHFGKRSGFLGYFWAIVLAGLTVGGIYVAFPVAYSLHKKGARVSVIFAYVGFAGLCRIPMTIFEASFLGPKFTAVRLGVSIPLVLFSAILMGRFLERRGYQIRE